MCQQPEALSPLPLQFIAEPSNQIAARTDTTVTFQCAIATISDYQVDFLWKFNGGEIDASNEDLRVSSENFLSRLEVQVSNSTEGTYQCIVFNEQLKYNVTSRCGYLKIAGKL